MGDVSAVCDHCEVFGAGHPAAAESSLPKFQLTDLDLEEFENLIDGWRQDGVELLELGGLPPTRGLADLALAWATRVRTRHIDRARQEGV